VSTFHILRAAVREADDDFQRAKLYITVTNLELDFKQTSDTWFFCTLFLCIFSDFVLHEYNETFQVQGVVFCA